MAPASSSGAMMVRLKAVRGAITACWSVISCSRPRPLPRSSRALTLLSTSMGTESEKAWPMAVPAFTTPGPVIRTQTPGLPEARA